MFFFLGFIRIWFKHVFQSNNLPSLHESDWLKNGASKKKKKNMQNVNINLQAIKMCACGL